jgi:outer membrane protein W
MSLAPDGDESEYDNTLNLFPCELGIVYRFNSEMKTIVPYYSVGIGGYYGTMDIKRSIENLGDDWISGSAFSVGIYNALGIYIAIYHDLLLNTEIKMNFASGTWELKDQEEGIDASVKFEKLNTGGTTFKIGLAFRF